VFRAADGVRRVGGEDLADDQPVEEHADRRQMLLHRRLRHRGLELFDIGGDEQRLDADELVDAVLLEPGEEVAHGPVIGGARVLLADRGGEEFEEAARRMLAGGCDDRRDDDAASRYLGGGLRLRSGDDLVHAVSVT
jgi:hypothetical protein